MSRTPLDMMLDKVDWTCTRCGAPKTKGCDCWSEVKLRCPQCKRTKMVTRDESDPAGTAVVDVLCDRCDDGGGFPETHYYDAKGNLFDGDKFVSTVLAKYQT